MTVDIDALLSTDMLSVPEDFSRRVMREVHAQHTTVLTQNRRVRLQWLALLAAAGLGISQLVAFIFGMWATTAAL